MKVAGVRFVQGRNRYGPSTKYAIAVHATANTAPAANEAAYATWRTDGTSAHFYIDGADVVQSLDTADRAGHAGSTQGNTYAIALEFTGLNSWSRARWLSSVAWDRIGAVLAAVSRHHGIPATRVTVAQMKANPRVRGAYDHNQMRLAWGGTDHTDPGPNFPWDHLLAVWQRHLSGEDDDMPTTPADFKELLRKTMITRSLDKKQIPLLSIAEWADQSHVTTRRVVTTETGKLAAKLDALAAAFTALASGGTSIDTGAVLAEVRRVGDELGAQLAATEAKLIEAEAEIDQLRASLAAGARAEADALEQN